MKMLNIFSKRLPKELKFISYKETNSKYKVTVGYQDITTVVELHKAVVPGCHNKIVDIAIITAMSTLLFKKGDVEGARAWLDKLTSGGNSDG